MAILFAELEQQGRTGRVELATPLLTQLQQQFEIGVATLTTVCGLREKPWERSKYEAAVFPLRNDI